MKSSPIPYGRQNITQEDIDAVVEILRSDWLTQGPAIEQFENKVARYCGVEHSVAVCNATAALHIGCLALGLKPGDLLWTVPNTFVASANCGLYCGAEVDFVDIDPKTWNISIDQLEKKLVIAKKNDRLPSILIPVHFSGQSCEMKRIHELSKMYGFKILEDASHAIGGQYHDKPIGNCEFSDAAVFSFHPVKIITTGEGGMVLTRDKKTYESLKLLRTHGITRDPAQMKNPSLGGWYYEQIDLGFNYRITDIQAALGSSQMDRLDQFVRKRTELAERYNQLLSNLPVTLPWQHPPTQSAHHLYVIRLKVDEISISHSSVFEKMRAAGIGVNLHYYPVHLQPYYQGLGFKKGDFPEAERYYQEAISLPLYFDLSRENQDRVVDAMKSALFSHS